MIGISTAPVVANLKADKRMVERRTVSLPARLTWKDARGTMRFASVIARNVSEFGVYIECPTPVSIPLYRLVQVQIEREGVPANAMPPALTRGRVLSAVYRVSPASMVAAEQTRATA